MDYKRSELSECELITMKCVWDAGGSANCAQVRKALKKSYGRDYKLTTVYTFLKKLIEKGFVEQKKERVSEYSALRRHEEYLSQEMGKQKQFWFEGSSAEFILFLIREGGLTGEEELMIRNALNNKREAV